MASTMAWCTRLSAVLLLTSLQMNGKFTKATRFEGINPALIKLKVRQGSDGINVTWNRPNKKITHTCYDTNLQYRSQCGSDWLNFVLHSFSFVLGDLGRGCGRNYTFRARMRYACLYRSWSPWSPEKHWTEETVSASCFKAKPNLHLLISLIPAIFLLGLLMAQKPIRRLILSKVPDPKHIYDDLLKIDQSQLEQTFKDHNAECETFKIEIVQPEKEVEEEQSKQSADAGPTETVTLTPDSATLTPEPATLTPEPATLTPEPAALTPEPVALTPEPATLTPDSATLTPDSATLTPEPATLTPEPAALTPEPAALTPEPVALTPDSTTLTPEPATLTPEPATLTPEPATLTPEPATLTPDSTTLTPEPATLTPEPATLTPEPATLTPEPATLTPEPATLTPEPATLTPEPATLTPEPATLTPEPAALTPDSAVRGPTGPSYSPAHSGYVYC